MLLGLSEPLPRLVESKFQVAKATHSLIFSPTELAIVQTTAGIPFQIRYCPSLAKKRTAQKDDMPREKKDPFDNPSPDLWIADIQATDPTHLLVLNKFPVIANHFILATKTSQPQTHLLEEVDLDATYSCLQAWEQQHSIEKPQRLFAFFNSGHHSGASQPHRHVQFLPVENMSDAGSSAGWNLLIDTMATTLDPPRTGDNSFLGQHPKIPFAQFVAKIPPNPTTVLLLHIYHALYRAAKQSIESFIKAQHGDGLTLHSAEDGSVPISYNLAMTTTAMAILPRRCEGSTLVRSDGSDIGFVALNGTALAGTLMVKYQEEWDVLRAQPEKLDQILGAIGLPTNSSTSADDDKAKP